MKINVKFSIFLLVFSSQIVYGMESIDHTIKIPTVIKKYIFDMLNGKTRKSLVLVNKDFKKIIDERRFYKLTLPTYSTDDKLKEFLDFNRIIKILNLGYNKIGVKGATQIANRNLTNLETLNLAFNRIRDSGATQIANGKFTNLTNLNLRGNDIGPEGTTQIATRNLINLTNLNLGINDIGDKGATQIAKEL